MSETRVAGVRLSSPEKVLFPSQGITKRRLAEYWVAIADAALPHLRRRPVSLLRCPEGEEAACFFQRHPGAGLPKAIRSLDIEEKDGETGRYLLLDGLGGIVSAVQMGTLELHIWGCRDDDIERPDRMVFDLDPDAGLDFAMVRDAALELRELLQGLGLESYPLLTGGKGIHLVLPLQRRQEWPVVKAFSHAVAEALTRSAPTRFTTNMRKDARGGKIFVDYLRNERGSTAILPWSSRAHARAPVAMPVSWAELAEARRSDAYTIDTAPDRVAQDPWPGYAASRQAITRKIAEKVDALG
jgi:bifunctional non-homologous end joining protein LigD